MEIILYKILLVLLYVILGAVMLSTSLGIPGNWILVAVAVVTALVTRFQAMTWGYLLLCVGLAGLGELIESVAGALLVAKRGGSRWGVMGSIAGGFTGVILGAPVSPPVGSVVFGFLGAFVGAVAGEMVHRQDLQAALRVGWWSFVGRGVATASKLAVGVGILWVIISVTWP